MPNSLPLVTLDQEFKNKKFFQFWLSLVAVRRRPMKTRFHKFVILLPFVLTPIRTTAFFFILLKGYVLQAYPIAPYFVFAFPLLAIVNCPPKVKDSLTLGQWPRPPTALRA